MKISKTYLAIGILIIFYLVGIVGLSMDEYRPLFAGLSALNLLLTAGLLVWANADNSKRFYAGMLLTMSIGFAVEVLGVHTGLLFGSYYYGKALGWSLFEVPLIIGVNWFLLAFATQGIAQKLVQNSWMQIVVGSTLMVGIDLLIEPVAIALDFWHWDQELIPTQNYLMWFLVALPIQYILQKTTTQMNTSICLGVYGIQLAFFMALNLSL